MFKVLFWARLAILLFAFGEDGGIDGEELPVVAEATDGLFFTFAAYWCDIDGVVVLDVVLVVFDNLVAVFAGLSGTLRRARELSLDRH